MENMKELIWSRNGDGENIVTIDGKSIVLTETIWDEILELLRKTASKDAGNPFARGQYGEKYYYISSYGHIGEANDTGHPADIEVYDNVNYFQDTSTALQVALHQLLYRKLLKFTYDNDCVDIVEWGRGNMHWFIYYNRDAKEYQAAVTSVAHQFSTVYFSTEEAAEQAINEVVRPFMSEHPEFVW